MALLGLPGGSRVMEHRSAAFDAGGEPVECAVSSNHPRRPGFVTQDGTAGPAAAREEG